ncbi:Zn-ribbon domain-containing OB-fold protein [Delftia tsuruhatensis]|uniref:Zn-ribbon domain-containing OB-fold protein n=1 Tax=Delftia tsuruhatensis TaxID=180282 RepID=UPI002AD40932|nr:OB-fold domain-containing protein [Delftia tsuruhatensis]WQM85933.1 zinc ribbon domain-containing protein [Delftia tsuruhatensis]
MTDDLRGFRPQHPSLYQLAADGRSLEFLYVQCPACAKLSFPANVPGCGHCGDPLQDAQTVARPGAGTLLEFVTLHVPLLPGLQTPRIAADIRIADGLVEEGVVAVSDESQLHVGMQLRAVAVAQASGEIFDCRFVPAQAGGAA